MKEGKLLLFRLLSDLWQFETFCSISIQTHVADVIIMHSVEETV